MKAQKSYMTMNSGLKANLKDHQKYQFKFKLLNLLQPDQLIQDIIELCQLKIRLDLKF